MRSARPSPIVQETSGSSSRSGGKRRRNAADANGFRFENEYGYVQYGNATAIDALGRTFALHSELVEGAIDIAVPADFAARAALPLVIDPLIAAYPIHVGGLNALQPDVVYDGSGNYVMHCWEEAYSATDHDVYSVILDIGPPQMSRITEYTS